MVMSGTAASTKATDHAILEQAIAVLRDNATRFARTAPAEKAQLLRDCIPRLVEVAPAWVTAGCQAKGIGHAESGEEWIAGPMPTIRLARLLAQSLDAIALRGRPPLGTGSRTRPDGRLEVDIFPSSNIDKVLFTGFSGKVLMEAGVDRATAIRRQASFYHKRNPEGGVSLVLGAGNVSSIPPMDVFSKMFVEGFVCLLKMNPVNEWVGPHLERGLQPLIERGILRIVYGGAAEGTFLVEHDGIDDVHITGSDRTHDAIVWGPPGAERDRRMADDEPRLQKPISSELGNVSPVAIVPYTYGDDELWFQARSLASMVVNNASFNCNAAKLLITSKDWAQREQFLSLVARALSQVPSRRAYYPGAFDRYASLTRGRELQTFGEATPEKLPWTLIRNVDSERADDPLFKTEPFCGILTETTVGSADPVEFLDRATAFMNDRVWGTLNCAIVIHGKLESDPTVGAVLDRSVAALRYGTVAINHWPALCYGAASMPWGGHQSVNLKNIQSGLGWVHNSYMLEGIDKSIVRGKLKVAPAPVWFYDNLKTAELGPRLVAMEADPRWWKVPGILVKAL
jgi:acyl-CoA reductase-like NAD-dependent aldehyde dehydrogenase